jgi:hypothetical protein
MIPIFLGFSFEIIMVASLRNPAMRTGLTLKAGKSVTYESLPSISEA